MFPQSALSTLYVKGSLKNTAAGFEFCVKNTIDSTSLYGAGPILVDGQAAPLERVTLSVAAQEMRGQDISSQRRLAVTYGALVTIRVDGQTLSSGEHRIVVAVSSSDAGRVQFEVRDSV